jgi:hypothetical protein
VSIVDDRQFLLSYFGRADVGTSVRLGVATDASYSVSDVDEMGADCDYGCDARSKQVSISAGEHHSCETDVDCDCPAPSPGYYPKNLYQ